MINEKIKIIEKIDLKVLQVSTISGGWGGGLAKMQPAAPFCHLIANFANPNINYLDFN